MPATERQRACVPFVTRTYAVNKRMCHKPTCAVWRADPRAWAALGRGPPHRNPNFRRCPRGLAYAYDGLGRGPTRPSKPGDDKCCRGPACGQALGSKLIDALDVTIAARPRPWVGIGALTPESVIDLSKEGDAEIEVVRAAKRL